MSVLAYTLLTYLALLNLTTFVLFAMDKYKSAGSRRRIPEKKLLFFSLIGGSLGAIVGMHTVRHKTRKISFQLKLALILLVQMGVVYAVVFL